MVNFPGEDRAGTDSAPAPAPAPGRRSSILAAVRCIPQVRSFSRFKHIFSVIPSKYFRLIMKMIASAFWLQHTFHMRPISAAFVQMRMSWRANYGSKWLCGILYLRSKISFLLKRCDNAVSLNNLPGRWVIRLEGCHTDSILFHPHKSVKNTEPFVVSILGGAKSLKIIMNCSARLTFAINCTAHNSYVGWKFLPHEILKLVFLNKFSNGIPKVDL